ncbi:MAG: anti-sigma factor family protein [Candidatus Binatia bacterium]
MNCRETRPLLPLFFDGELEARQMRAVALHSTRCGECEGELRQLEHLQERITAHVSALVDEVDLSQIWAGVAPRLVAPTPSMLERLRTWWGELDLAWPVRGPAFAVGAVAALLALAVWQYDPSAAEKELTRVQQVIDNTAVLDSVQSSVESVALVTDSETNTTLLWIMDDNAAAGDHAAEQWEGSE